VLESGTDPEIVDSKDGSRGKAPGRGFGALKLNTFAYLAVNFACISHINYVLNMHSQSAYTTGVTGAMGCIFPGSTVESHVPIFVSPPPNF